MLILRMRFIIWLAILGQTQDNQFGHQLDYTVNWDKLLMRNCHASGAERLKILRIAVPVLMSYQQIYDNKGTFALLWACLLTWMQIIILTDRLVQSRYLLTEEKPNLDVQKWILIWLALRKWWGNYPEA